MTAETRYRESGGFTPLYSLATQLRSNGTVVGTVVQSLANANGTKRTMRDVVTTPFRAGRIITNSPMEQTIETRTSTLLVGSQTHSNPGASSVATITGSYSLGSYDSTFDTYNAGLSPARESLIQQACTQALANVHKPEVFGLVALKEMRETVKGLIRPLTGALNFLGRNAPGARTGKRLTTKNARWSAKQLADQHLSIVFGLLPFISDVQGTLKALEAVDVLSQRYTARGYGSATDSNVTQSTTVSYEDAATRETVVRTYDNRVTVTVRAYQLYEAQLKLDALMGVRPQDVPLAIWQTATLSFVADWFANVGHVISALTPREGVSYLASGYVIDTVYANSVVVKDTIVRKSSAHGWTGGWYGTQARVKQTKSRVPESLFGNIAVVRKRNAHRDQLNTGQVMSLLSLITQKLA